jgi:hypothetical protein
MIRLTHRHPRDGVRSGGAELSGAAKIGRERVHVAEELRMPQRHRLGKAEPRRAHRRRIQIRRRQDSAGYGRLSEKYGLGPARREPDGAGGGSSERELTSEERDTNDSLRSGRSQAEAGAGSGTGADLGIGW